MFQETCEGLIDKARASAGLSGQIYEILIRRPGHFPGMEDVARTLNMTSWMLRRRLKEEEISFSEILDDVYRSLAVEYLKTTHMSVDDIGMLVGFNDVANFRKAFRRWTGQTPSEIRREITRKWTSPIRFSRRSRRRDRSAGVRVSDVREGRHGLQACVTKNIIDTCGEFPPLPVAPITR